MKRYTKEELETIFENNFDCYADTTNDSVEMAMTKERYIEVLRELKILSIQGVVFSEARAEICKRNYHWKECVTWTNDCRCINSCDLHKQT